MDGVTPEAPGGRPAADWTIAQDWASYGAAEHAVWRRLFHRQAAVLVDRAAPAFLAGLDALTVTADRIPDFERLSERLERATGWRIVAVPGLVPDPVFFAHLAARRFPATRFIRRPDQLDYIAEPDVFHDVFGHVPMLVDPEFADYMQAYGEGGLKALRLGSLDHLARLYWYTVEFGLMRTPAGLRIYGSGIVSSHAETLYALDSDRPQRLAFDLMRIMRTRYRIDDVQESYFVIDGTEQLFAATRPDFAPHYAALETLADIAPGARIAGDVPVARDGARAAP